MIIITIFFGKNKNIRFLIEINGNIIMESIGCEGDSVILNLPSYFKDMCNKLEFLSYLIVHLQSKY